MHVADMVLFWARAAPHRLALVQPDMVTTFQGLADAIESVGDRIDRLNLGPREPVAISIANPAFLVATAFALLRTGYCIAPVNPPLFPHLPAHSIRNLISDTQGLVVSGGRNIRFDMSWMPDPAVGTSRRPYRRRSVGTTSVTTFTFDPNRLPRKFVQTGLGLNQRFNPALASAGEQAKVLIVPGPDSALGFARTCHTLGAGQTVCFAPSPDAALWLIDAFGVDSIVTSPQRADVLADVRARSGGAHTLKSLTSIVINGALAPDSARRIKTRLCRHVVVSYGLGDIGTAAWAPYDAVADIPGAVGFILPEVEIEIVDGNGSPLPIGSEGTIRLRTRDLAANLKGEGADLEAAKNSRWFCPGDIGRITEHGVLCLAKSERDADSINGERTAGP